MLLLGFTLSLLAPLLLLVKTIRWKLISSNSSTPTTTAAATNNNNIRNRPTTCFCCRLGKPAAIGRKCFNNAVHRRAPRDASLIYCIRPRHVFIPRILVHSSIIYMLVRVYPRWLDTGGGIAAFAYEVE